MRNILLGWMLIALIACGGSESAEQYISSAREHLTSADYNAATIELKNALRLDANAAEARWLLGKLYLDQGDFPSAEKELQRAQALGWQLDDIYPALAQAWLAQGKFDDVLGLDDKTLAPIPAADLLASQALAELARGNVEEAGKKVALALANNPSSIPARLAEARLFASQGDATGSLIVLEEILESDSSNVDAWRLKGDVLMQLQELQAAREAYTETIKHARLALSDRVKRALINIQLQDYAAAQSDVDELLRVAPQNPVANYVQGLLHYQNKDYPGAVTALSLAEPVANQYPLVLFYLASAHLIEGNADRALQFARRFVSQVPDNIAGRKLLATLNLQQREPRQARETIQPVLDANPEDVEALNIMANALLLEGQTDQGMDLLARIAALQPDSPVAQMRLGAGLMLSGKGDEASGHLETALDINPEFQQADILLVLNQLQKQDYEGAIEAARAYQRRHIGEVAPYNVLGRVYMAAGQSDQAREAFDKALRFEPGDPSAHLSLAEMALAEGDNKAARQHYQNILEHHAYNLPTLLALAALEAREKNEEAMVRWLTWAIDKHPSVLQPRLMLARYYLGSGKTAQVTPLFADLDELQRRSRPVLELTAMAQLSGKEHDIARASLEQLIATNPETAHYHYLLAVAAGRSGDQDKAQRELREAYRLDNKHIPTVVALARLALAEQRPEDFDQHLQALQQLAPGAAEVLRLSAIAALRAEDTGGAVQLATRAFETAPSTQTLLELVSYQKRAGKAEAAMQLMQQWVDDHPDDVAARLALGNDLQLANDVPAAQKQFLAVVERAPANVMALNNLAWNLRQDEPAQALEYIRRAARAAPERPEVLDTLAVIEHLNGENRAAYRNIERALIGAPENPSMRYHKAMIGASLGEKHQAIALLEELLVEGAPDFPEREEAAQLLKRLQG
ncbi:XrtA/PEP-CTERM system TPR-repeat protein PrsT [Seongchinamella sediminis]|nr:XrtA/PEP-CTERM system TPR-repeat protein PrsT [Seongchinamella sediminis]